MKLVLLMAMTVDGKIARFKDHFPDWTGKADKRMFKQMTTRAGVIVMGSRTFDTIGKALPGRLNIIMTRRPERYRSSDNLIFTADPPDKVVDQLIVKGYETVVLAGGATINSLFAQAGLIDEMVVTVIPKVFGSGVSIFARPLDAPLELVESREIEPGILVLHYKFI